MREAEPVDLLVANAGTGTHHDDEEWEFDLDAWWRTFEVNVLGVHLTCRAAIPGMLERGVGRIVIVGSGASYLPGASETAYTSSKAAVGRYGETLANALRDRIPVFVISPGLVRTAMTDGHFADDAPWTPPELRHNSCWRSPRASSTRSRAATSTPSTTRPSRCAAASTRSSSTTGTRSGCGGPEFRLLG